MPRALATAATLALLVLLAGSCASQRVDWAGRVGTYTRDDAIREYGPPDKSATLSDGSVVADWLESRGMQTATAYPGAWGPYGRRIGTGPGLLVLDPPAPNRFLRLTFDPHGKLASWKKVVQ